MPGRRRKEEGGVADRSEDAGARVFAARDSNGFGAMPVEYVNRKGARYYLQSGKTRSGKPRYYFGRKLTGTPVEEVPDGYEIYESPEAGQVYLRKSKPTEISPFERELVCDRIRRLARLEYFIVDVQQNSLVVYMPATDETAIEGLIEMLDDTVLPGSARGQKAKDEMMRASTYSKMMRFELVDFDERLFRVERWCFLGSIDQWIHLDGPAPLPDLVGKYVRHLGKETFFELM